MAGIARTGASIRVFGEDLDPVEVTGLLGAEPTHQSRKGDVRASGFIQQQGAWRLRAPEREPGDLEGQLRDLLSALTDDLAIWRDLGARYRVDVFCSLMMEATNEGLSLSPSLQALLAERGLSLGLDIYTAEQPQNRD